MTTYATYADMPPAVRQELAAMNAHTYDMSDEERARWYAEHPLDAYSDEAMAPLFRVRAQIEQAASDYDTATRRARAERIDQKLIRNQLHPEEDR